VPGARELLQGEEQQVSAGTQQKTVREEEKKEAHEYIKHRFTSIAAHG